MKTFIYVKFNLTGFHKWNDAPSSRAYLGVLHRHSFWVKVKLQVFENDREVEFHDFLDFCQINFTVSENESCEQMAINLIKKITSAYPGREVICDVSEDNENGAIVEYLP